MCIDCGRRKEGTGRWRKFLPDVLLPRNISPFPTSPFDWTFETRTAMEEGPGRTFYKMEDWAWEFPTFPPPPQ